MKYAIIQIGSKQYKISEGDDLLLPKLDKKPKTKLNFDQVLMLKDEQKVKLGTPFIAGAKVTAKVIEHSKGKKIRVATFRPKTRYRRVKGYRDHLTLVKIDRILRREKKQPTKSK